jgi:hypothetical protein
MFALLFSPSLFFSLSLFTQIHGQQDHSILLKRKEKEKRKDHQARFYHKNYSLGQLLSYLNIAPDASEPIPVDHTFIPHSLKTHPPQLHFTCLEPHPTVAKNRFFVPLKT